jgi:hypothetical protein
MELPPAVKKNGVIIVGALAGIYLVIKYMRGSSASAAPSAGNGMASYLAASNQSQALAQQGNFQAAQLQLAANAQASQNQLQRDQLSAATNVAMAAAATAQTNAIGNTAGQIGSAISSIVQSQSLLPALAMNNVGAMNQQTLSSAARVAAATIASVPGALYAVGTVAQATAAPIAQYGRALNGFDTTLAYTGANAMNSIVGVSTPSVIAAANSASASAQANAQASAATMAALSNVATAAIAA